MGFLDQFADASFSEDIEGRMTIRPLGFNTRPRIVSPTAYAALKTHIKAQFIVYVAIMTVTVWATRTYHAAAIFLGGLALVFAIYLIWYTFFIGPIIQALPKSDIE